MIRNCWWWISRAAVPFLTIPFFLYVPLADAQGTVEDYQRAQRFLPGNLLRRLVYVADVHPNWIEKTKRFWTDANGVYSGGCGAEYFGPGVRS